MAERENEGHNQASLLQEVLNELKQQREEVKSLREEVQGSSVNISTEVNKLISQKEINWKYNGNKVQF